MRRRRRRPARRVRAAPQLQGHRGGARGCSGGAGVDACGGCARQLATSRTTQDSQLWLPQICGLQERTIRARSLRGEARGAEHRGGDVTQRYF